MQQYLCLQCRTVLKTGDRMCQTCDGVFDAVKPFDPNSSSMFWPPKTIHNSPFWEAWMFLPNCSAKAAVVVFLVSVAVGVNAWQHHRFEATVGRLDENAAAAAAAAALPHPSSPPSVPSQAMPPPKAYTGPPVDRVVNGQPAPVPDPLPHVMPPQQSSHTDGSSPPAGQTSSPSLQTPQDSTSNQPQQSRWEKSQAEFDREVAKSNFETESRILSDARDDLQSCQSLVQSDADLHVDSGTVKLHQGMVRDAQSKVDYDQNLADQYQRQMQ